MIRNYVISNRDVGSFKQCPDGLDLFGGEFGGEAAFSRWPLCEPQGAGGVGRQVQEELGEVALGSTWCRRQVEVRLARMAAVRPPRGLPTNNEFFRLKSSIPLPDHPTDERRNSLFFA